MNVLIFGASGMVGQGVLLECLRDERVARVLVLGRNSAGRQHAKLREMLVPDLFDLAAYADQLDNPDACFFALGVSSSRMNEESYRRLTYDLTIAIARELAARNPAMCFIYVSGTGTDSTTRGRVMWARVKGATENALLAMPFRRAYMFRPGAIQSLEGIRSKTPSYRILYGLLGWLLPLLHRLFPRSIVTTREVGRAMLSVARNGWPSPVLEPKDIHAATTRAT
jgi:uncharacterized protein YbjT (DUF2867 family)